MLTTRQRYVIKKKIEPAKAAEPFEKEKDKIEKLKIPRAKKPSAKAKKPKTSEKQERKKRKPQKEEAKPSLLQFIKPLLFLVAIIALTFLKSTPLKQERPSPPQRAPIVEQEKKPPKAKGDLRLLEENLGLGGQIAPAPERKSEEKKSPRVVEVKRETGAGGQPKTKERITKAPRTEKGEKAAEPERPAASSVVAPAATAAAAPPLPEEASPLKKQLAEMEKRVNRSSVCYEGERQEDFPFRETTINNIRISITRCTATVREIYNDLWSIDTTPNYRNFSFKRGADKFEIIISKDYAAVNGQQVSLSSGKMYELKSLAMLHAVLWRAFFGMQREPASTKNEQAAKEMALNDINSAGLYVEKQIADLLKGN